MNTMSSRSVAPARLSARPAARAAAVHSGRGAVRVCASGAAQLAKFNKAGSVAVVDGNGGLPKVCLVYSESRKQILENILPVARP